MASSMIRGFLNILVLKALGEEPKSGYNLMKFVEKRIGVKPSPGSIYPLLEQLESEGFIEIKKKGKAKEYKLTATGRKKLSAIEEKRCECLCNFTEGMKMLSALTGEDMSFPMAMVENMHKGIMPFKEINPEWDTLRNELFVQMQKGTLKQNSKKIRTVLAKTNKELKSL
ncbi:PadR family transcriptional regulator [Candidatus Woesearchaeota archaeon]|nr:PadR family transcriptional regulator [Candidatus Woesearchaeota archaeon]